MANREALRELQARLASRLQAARTEGVSVAWLAVRAGGYNFLLPLGQSGEIFPLASLQGVPHSKPWFRGVLNIRGGLFGVVDVTAFFAVDAAMPRVEQPSTDPSVVTFNAALEVNCALQVDSLLGLRGADDFVSSAVADAGVPDYFGNQFVDASGAKWQEVNLRILSQSPSFLSISV
jgi:twitching motility protein PilI